MDDIIIGLACGFSRTSCQRNEVTAALYCCNVRGPAYNRGRRIFSPRRGRKPRGALCGAARQGHGRLSADRDARQPLGAPASARDGRRVLVQQESHVYNDEGDCAGSSAASHWFLSHLVGRRSPWPTWRPSCDVSKPDECIRRLAQSRSSRRCAASWARSLISPRCRRSPHSRASGGSDCTSTAPACSSLRPTRGSRPRPARHCSTPSMCALQIFQRRFGCDPRRAAAFAGKSLSRAAHVRRRLATGMARCGCGAALSRRLSRWVRPRRGGRRCMYVALDQHPRCQVARRPAGTNVVRLHVKGADAAALPELLRSRGIMISPAQRPSPRARFCAADQREPAETSDDANHSRVYGSVRIVRDEAATSDRRVSRKSFFHRMVGRHFAYPERVQSPTGCTKASARMSRRRRAGQTAAANTLGLQVLMIDRVSGSAYPRVSNDTPREKAFCCVAPGP